MIRPLVTALIEYFLAYSVYRYGKNYRKTIALTLFFLATYQLGEVLIFLTNGDLIGFKVAYVATTLLPPLGILLLEKIVKRSFGYPLFQLISLGFVAYILFIDRIAISFELGDYCIRIFEYTPVLANYWSAYYQGTLMLTMGIMVWQIWKTTNKAVNSDLKKMLIAYISFDGLAMLLVYLLPELQHSAASLMCALALFAAFIFARISLGKNFNIIRNNLFKRRPWDYKLGKARD